MSSLRPTVGWIQIVWGVMSFFPVMLLFVLFSGVMGLVAALSEGHGAIAALGATFAVILTVLLIILGAAGFFSILAGIGVLRNEAWGDILTVIASVLHLANVPIGTGIGLFSLWVLLVREPRSKPMVQSF